MIKVLVVDDSAFMRKVISDILKSDPQIDVIGTAINGKFAIEKIKTLSPDIVTMDIEMPEMDGITAIKNIMKERPLPIVVISAYSESGSKQALAAMEAGAVDFILKPSGEISLDMNKIREDIINKIKVAAKAQIQPFKKPGVKKFSFAGGKKKIILIGCSTGGPQALEALLPMLPKNIPAPILIAQHMPPLFTKSLAERLNSVSGIIVKEAKEGDKIEDGVALIAPGDFHMELKPDVWGSEALIRLNQESSEVNIRPSVNKLFISVAKIYRENTIGVVLTGIGSDGREGCRFIKELNGTVIAESEKTSIIFGMPKEVIKAGLADKIVDIDQMAEVLVNLVNA